MVREFLLRLGSTMFRRFEGFTRRCTRVVVERYEKMPWIYICILLQSGVVFIYLRCLELGRRYSGSSISSFSLKGLRAYELSLLPCLFLDLAI